MVHYTNHAGSFQNAKAFFVGFRQNQEASKVKTIEQLKAELSDLTAKQKAILDAADKDNGGKLSTEQQADFDKLDESKASLKAELAAVKDAIKRRDALADDQKDLDWLDQAGRVTRKTTPDSLRVREGFLDDPKRGFKTHRDFLMAVMDTARVGKIEDPRIKSLAAGSDEASTVSDPYGGFLLPSGFMPDLKSIGAEGDPTAGRTTPVPMTTSSISMPARVDKNHTSSVSGGLRVYRRNETDTSASSRMEMEQIKLEPTMLLGISYATEELLARSPISFVSLLEVGFRDEFAAKILKEKLFGTGAGQMQGVTNSPCVVDQAKETGQPAATIVKENIDKMRSRCWGYSNAIWLYNHDCLPQLRSLVQAVGTGGSVVNYFETVTTVGPGGELMSQSFLDGRPAFPSEFCKTLGTSGDIILGNWSQYLEATLTGQQSDESIHVRFANLERTFRFYMENDGKCWWTAALTPNQSSTTLSPFVTLATRA